MIAPAPSRALPLNEAANARSSRHRDEYCLSRSGAGTPDLAELQQLELYRFAYHRLHLPPCWWLRIWHPVLPHDARVQWCASVVHRPVPSFAHTNEDSIGNMTISFISHQHDAPLFFVNNGQLFQSKNESYILPVSVLNTTSDTDEPLPYKLALARQRDGLRDMMWRWRGTFLHLHHDQRTNNGLYYKCATSHGEGVYTSFDP